ncbi:MAG TPA: hypothetical protein VNO23_19440 [Candidatus Binatia bacterium]|nr:hypothetical protein [Candidatus Binatia bacterium]
MARTPPSRVSSARILRDLRQAARKGDRSALAVALDQMRTLALSPRYWERYLLLLQNPLARLVDLLVIKQGERIAHQKGWKAGRRAPARSRRADPASSGRRPAPARRRRSAGAARPAPVQPSLFE